MVTYPVHWLKAVALSVGGAVLSACSPLSVLDLVVPSDTYRATTDIAYGSLKEQRLDIYKPKSGDAPYPVVVFFYGGSWRWGSRGEYRFVGEALARRGILTVIPDYRLYPQVRFPAFVRDSAAAFAWTKRTIQKYGGNPDRVFLAGHSAGAHNAAMVALNPEYLREQDLKPDAICGFVGLAGPYYFNPVEYDSVREIFEHLPDPDAARPVTFANADAPPMLLLHGARDTTVYPLNSLRLNEALLEKNVDVQLEIVPDVGHYRIIGALAKPLEGIAPVADRIADYVRSGDQC